MRISLIGGSISISKVCTKLSGLVFHSSGVRCTQPVEIRHVAVAVAAIKLSFSSFIVEGASSFESYPREISLMIYSLAAQFLSSSNVFESEIESNNSKAAADDTLSVNLKYVSPLTSGSH